MKVLTCLFLLVTASLAHAGTVRAYVYDFYPMGDADNLDGEYPGMFYEMAQAILEASGLEHEIFVEPIPRTLEKLRRGDVDMLIGLPTPGSSLTVPMHCNQIVLVTNQNQLNSIADLEGAKVGFVTNGLFERLYGDKFGTVNESSASDFGLINMLQFGRIDGFIITKNVINSYRFAPPPGAQLPAGWDDNLHYGVTIDEKQVYLQFPEKSSLDDSQRQKLMSSALDLNEKGVIARILQRYGTQQMQSCY